MRKRDLAFADHLRTLTNGTGHITDEAKIAAAKMAYGGMTSDEAFLKKAESKLAVAEIAAMVKGAHSAS